MEQLAALAGVVALALPEPAAATGSSSASATTRPASAASCFITMVLIGGAVASTTLWFGDARLRATSYVRVVEEAK